MEIFYDNLPESNEEVNLIIESSILNQNSQLVYNANNENGENNNDILIDKNKYKYSFIYKDLEKDKYSNIILDKINIKNNISLLLLVNNSKIVQEENSTNNINYSTEVKNCIKNIFNKENIEKLNIKNIIYNYFQINLETNKVDNIIKDKLINEESSYAIDIPDDNNEGNISNSLLKLKIDYSDINISSFVQILFIYNSYEKILPLYALNKKEYEILLLKEKINNLLSLEKDMKEKINNIPMINTDFLQNINVYEQEVVNYYSNFVNNLRNIDTKNSKNNKDKSTANINDLITEVKNVLNSLNNEQFKQREKDIYEKYIQVYSAVKNNENSDSNNNTNGTNYDYTELKMIINKFNNLNEELIDILENENKSNDKDKDKEINNEIIKEKEEEIDELKNKIEQLEKDLKEEKNKNKNPPPNQQSSKVEKNSKSSKNRSVSEPKIDSNKYNKNNSYGNNNNARLEEENKNLKKKIDELKETISKLKTNNDNLFKTNEKLLKEKNNLKNELLKEKTSANTNNINENISSDNTISNERHKSPTKSANIFRYNSTTKSQKRLNKNQNNNKPVFDGESLLLLQKISKENKELAKQLKDFSSKNVQLELSLKGINNGEVNNIRSHMGNSSMLSNFTKNTRNELKNIEKKYGLSKK